MFARRHHLRPHFYCFYLPLPCSMSVGSYFVNVIFVSVQEAANLCAAGALKSARNDSAQRRPGVQFGFVFVFYIVNHPLCVHTVHLWGTDTSFHRTAFVRCQPSLRRGGHEHRCFFISVLELIPASDLCVTPPGRERFVPSRSSSAKCRVSLPVQHVCPCVYLLYTVYRMSWVRTVCT